MKSGCAENPGSQLCKKMGGGCGEMVALRQQGEEGLSLHNYQGQPFGSHLAHRPFAS